MAPPSGGPGFCFLRLFGLSGGMTRRPARPSRAAVPWPAPSLGGFALLFLACLLAACRDERPAAQRTTNAAYGFSIVLPTGWPTFEEKTRDCLTRLGARGPDGGLVYVCVGPRPADFATSASDYVNREQIRTYVEDTLLGRHVECRNATIQGRRGYQALYLRDVANEAGAVAKQFIDQTFLVRGALLYAVTSYAMGATEAEAHKAFDAHSEVVLRSVMSFFLHPLPGPAQPTPAPGP